MAAIIWSDVLALAPELSTVNATAQTYILAQVNEDLDVSMLDGEDGPTTRLARIWLAAHYGTLVGKGTQPGPLISHSAGGLSRTYGSYAATDASNGMTSYGRLYLSLIQNSILPVIVG